MRVGTAQQSSAANPLVTVAVDSDVYKTEGGGGNERILRVYTDEQAWGGEYIIELDNDDGTLDAKDYEGEGLTLNFSFIGETTDNHPPLWVIYQEHISEEGKIRLVLHCGDAWSLIAAHNVALVNASFNQEWQTVDGLAGRQMPDKSLITDAKWSSLYNELVARGSKNIWAIIGYLETATGVTITMSDTDSYITSLKPPISLANARAGLRQLMDYTESYLRLTAGGGLTVIQPSAHASVYTYDDLDVPFRDAESAEIVIPNRIWVWAFNEAGDVWHNGEAIDSTSYTKLGKYITRNYLVATLDNGNKKSEADLNDLAAGILSKLQGELSQGTMIAPMHCTQELFDKITIVDDRYASPKTIVGYVNRIIREYDRGVYRITIQLGGVTSGWTPPGGSDAPGLADSEPPTMPPSAAVAGSAIGAYIADVAFTSVDYNTVSWGIGRVTLADGRYVDIDAGSYNMGLDGAWYFYAILGNNTLQKSQTATDAVGNDRMLVAVASRGSSTSYDAYVMNPFTDSILINTDKVMDGLVTELKLANAAVTNVKLGYREISDDKIATDAIVARVIDTEAIRAEHIKAGEIQGIHIQAYTIEAIHLNVATLSAITADCGNLTAGTINGVTIYAGGGDVILDGSGIKIRGEKLLFQTGSGTTRGRIYILNSDLWIVSPAHEIYIEAATNLWFESGSSYAFYFTGGPVRLPTRTSDPSKVEGFMYVNTATDELCICVGGLWWDVQLTNSR